MVIEWSQFDNDFRGVIALKMGVSYRLVRTKWQNSTNFVRFEREYLAETSQLGAFSVKTSQFPTNANFGSLRKSLFNGNRLKALERLTMAQNKVFQHLAGRICL